MDGKLAGKVALVTGSRQGLGLVFAKALANAGAEVILTSRDARQAEQAASDISRETSRNCRACALDVLDEKSVEAAAEFIAKATGRLDILVNNAAVGRGSTPLQDASLDEWNLTIGTNLTGTFLCMKHFGRLMIRQRSGKIINLTSLAARAVFDGAATGAYDCSKAAIGCLTRCMAGEWAKYGINVNSISPGFFLTDVNRKFLAKNPDFYEESLKALPIRRWGNPDEIGALAVYLAGPDSDYITGADFNIDGGYTLW
ncbi:MAG: SDR family oxidoreductase [Clostridiales bacterium]|nr:SDR family oxidoreductase [Clostridiales bacterium]